MVAAAPLPLLPVPRLNLRGERLRGQVPAARSLLRMSRGGDCVIANATVVVVAVAVVALVLNVLEDLDEEGA